MLLRRFSFGGYGGNLQLTPPRSPPGQKRALFICLLHSGRFSKKLLQCLLEQILSHPNRVEARLIKVHLPVLGSFVTAQDLFEPPGGLNAVRFPLPKPREAAPIQTAPKPETLRVGTVHGTLPKIVELRPFLTHDHSSPLHSLSQDLSKEFPHLAVDGIDFLPLSCWLPRERRRFKKR